MSVEVRSKEERFTVAYEALTNGDYDEACEGFRSLVEDYPDDGGIWWQFLSTLRRIRCFDEADAYNEKCLTLFPNDPGFVLEWTRSFDARATWDVAIARRSQMLKLYDPASDERFIPLVTEQFLPLIEMGRYDDLTLLLDYNWNLLKNRIDCVAAVYYALDALGDYERESLYLDGIVDLLDDPSGVSGDINVSNLRSVAQAAVWNRRWLKGISGDGRDIRVLSLGQSCLPFTVSNRWGLTLFPGDHAKITPFDLGAFGRNTAASAVSSDFSEFLDVNTYYEAMTPFGAPQMHHRPSGVHFGHERGRTIIGDDKSNFHSLMKMKIEAFRFALNNERCILVFGIVGPCEIEKFVEEIYPIIRDKNHRIVMLNLTRESLVCPVRSNVSYTHIPMPRDYSWNGLSDFSSDRGIVFEGKIINAIKKDIEKISHV
ncbi:tetratricopeptide repeat protein [Acetobacter sacchari]|uniref:Tetratricopeptide repeat protein n=1 Tax=Acetobacter sacchari TaxID=2661687 RepID=A0ABS3LT72_9PROT|nr:tetratricopeptide repeat protein [Acetobacter sacchari]MBO1359113.1 tetratricopeptide repeat protein [Acetobacter sacchari]